MWIVYLQYFEDFEWIHEYNYGGGGGGLVWSTCTLSDGCRGKTKQVTDNITLLTAWTLQHFPRISGWSCVPTYSDDMSRASAFAPLRGN
ncbi:unnamed protein product [Lathyrus oleraceus]